MKEPFQLFRKKEDQFIQVVTVSGGELWCCGECGTLYGSHNFQEPAQERATQCCTVKKCECGKDLPKFWMKCSDCRNNDSYNKHIASAEEVTDYDDYLYDDQNGKYYTDVEDFLDQTVDEDIEDLPEYLFACTELSFPSIDVGNILENALSDHHEDACDQVVDEEGLQKLLDNWVKKQTLISYDADYTRKISVAKLKELK